MYQKSILRCLVICCSIGCTGHGINAPDVGPGSALFTCASPIQPLDISNPTTVVGIGTASSCTEQSLAQAVARGGIITFNCGGAATIRIASEKHLRMDIDTLIDGGGVISLDGGGTSRLFDFQGPDYRKTTTTVTFQNITLTNGNAIGTSAPQWDGAGAAIFVNDGILHVINTIFQNNHGASRGAELGGGGIYAAGSREVIVVQSQFINNSAVVGGAIDSLNTDLTVMSSSFIQNTAVGLPGSALGGSGAAILIDGGSDLTHVFCGDTFSGNRATENGLGGAIFRTPDNDRQITIINRCTFEGNTSPGGGALYFHNSDLRITNSTFSNNTSMIGGALQADGTILTVQNSTFFNNQTSGPWGAIALFGDRGDIRNCTFVGNRASFAPILPDSAGVTVENSIFLGNAAADGSTGCASTSHGSANLQWPDPGIGGPNSLSGCVLGTATGDPRLGDLADNGGPTKTFLPDSSSAAARLGKSCPATDQRNATRANPGACTAGSVEIQ